MNIRGIIFGSLIIAAAILAAPLIRQTQTHFIKLDERTWFDQRDGTTYEYIGRSSGIENNDKTHRYKVIYGPGSRFAKIESDGYTM
ncbi:hypothetical protein SH528x_002994 [Novipirellula sp. SH528]|uniref:hypothetical protein n=1 Tax=Novipirellula sp. SH528 TaxID=3454466 RepID=UPI003F9EF23F